MKFCNLVGSNLLSFCAHVRSCVCFTSLWCILNWNFKKKSLISKYTELKITHILPSFYQLPDFISRSSWYLVIRSICGCSVTLTFGVLEVASLTWNIFIRSRWLPVAQSEVRSNNVTVSRLHFRWWKKINMMKVNFFFVLYVSLIEMLIDNHDYTHWNRNLAIARKKIINQWNRGIIFYNQWI